MRDVHPCLHSITRSGFCFLSQKQETSFLLFVLLLKELRGKGPSSIYITFYPFHSHNNSTATSSIKMRNTFGMDGGECRAVGEGIRWIFRKFQVHTQPGNIGPQDIPRTSPSNIPRTSLKDPI